MLCNVLYCIYVLYCIVLYCLVLYTTIALLYSTILYSILFNYTVMYCTTLYFTLLYFTVLYCTVLCRAVHVLNTVLIVSNKQQRKIKETDISTLKENHRLVLTDCIKELSRFMVTSCRIATACNRKILVL